MTTYMYNRYEWSAAVELNQKAFSSKKSALNYNQRVLLVQHIVFPVVYCVFDGEGE